MNPLISPAAAREGHPPATIAEASDPPGRLVADRNLWKNPSVMSQRLWQVGVAGCFVMSTAVPIAAQPVNASQPAAAQGQAYQRFLLGQHLERQEDLEGAIDAFREAAEFDPGSGEPLAELAALYSRASRLDDAMDAARSALEREADNLTAHRILGLIHASIANSRETTPEDITEAVTHLEQARGTILPDFQVELTLARLYLRTEDSNKAIELLEELRKDELGLGEAALLLSQAYEQAGRAEEALSTLEAVVASGRPSFRTLARLGELYERRRRLDDAVEAYRLAVARNPRSAGVRRRLANVLVETGDPAAARDVLVELTTMRPRDASGLYLLSEVELALNNFDEAEAVAERLVELEPGSIRGAFAMAQVFERRREYQRVVDTLEPALDEARGSDAAPQQLASLLGRLGFAHEQLGDLARATAVYEEAVGLVPASLAFGARLAQTYIDADRAADAMRVVQRAKNDHPNSLTLARLEARVLGDRGDIGEAAGVLEQALETNDGAPSAYVVLANFYSEHERVDDAVSLLETAQRRFPQDTSILFQLGAVLEQHDRFADAERAFRELLDRDPEHAATLNYLGYMLADRGVRLEESVELLRRAIEKDPHNGSYLDSLGWAYFKLDRLDLAEPPLREAGDQLPGNSVVQDHLGDLFSRLGRHTEAIEAWERALAGDGDDIDPDIIRRKIDDVGRPR